MQKSKKENGIDVKQVNISSFMNKGQQDLTDDTYYKYNVNSNNICSPIRYGIFPFK